MIGSFCLSVATRTTVLPDLYLRYSLCVLRGCLASNQPTNKSSTARAHHPWSLSMVSAHYPRSTSTEADPQRSSPLGPGFLSCAQVSVHRRFPPGIHCAKGRWVNYELVVNFLVVDNSSEVLCRERRPSLLSTRDLQVGECTDECLEEGSGKKVECIVTRSDLATSVVFWCVGRQSSTSARVN